jgi:hypothetical protein
MDIQRAILVRKQYDSLPIEAKQYVDALVLEAKQNPKSKYLEIFYKNSTRDNVIDTFLELKYNNANDTKIDWISFVAFKIWLFAGRFLTGVFIPKQLKKNANLFMLSITIASSFVVEGNYKERYGTSRIW